jgi:hypothetical protein
MSDTVVVTITGALVVVSLSLNVMTIYTNYQCRKLLKKGDF